MRKMKLILAAAALSAVLALPAALSAADAAFSVHKVFGSNMTLQRRAPIKISGKAKTGDTVTVTLEGTNAKPASAKADANGEWEVKLAAQEAGGPYKVKVVCGSDTVTFDNVLIGEVWYCSGQSNMELPVTTGNAMIQIKNHAEEAKNANYPKIRLYEIPKTKAPGAEFAEVVGGSWKECTPDSVKNFSAAGYFFGRQLQKDLDVPVGLIFAAWGGTKIEPWIPESEFVKNKRKEASQIEEAMLAGAATPNGQPSNRQYSSEQFPATLYGSMVNPWTRYTIHGVLWYQGESNTGNMDYYPLHKMLINGWRDKWGDPKMPFVICQLAGFEQWTPFNRLPEDAWGGKAPPNDVSGYVLTREIQDEMAKVFENVGVVNLIDIGDQSDIHPRDKQTLGFRLAKLVENKYLGGPLGVGPEYDHMTVNGSKIVIHFKNVGKGLTTGDGKAPGAFAIAGSDGKFVWGEAKIVGDTVEVSSPKIEKPAIVRYAYVSYRGDVNLQNKDGFAAYPFRTDKPAYEKK